MRRNTSGVGVRKRRQQGWKGFPFEVNRRFRDGVTGRRHRDNPVPTREETRGSRVLTNLLITTRTNTRETRPFSLFLSSVKH